MTCIVDWLACIGLACVFVYVLLCVHPDMECIFVKSRVRAFLKRLRYRFSKNAVHGYKGFRGDMTCNGMQYREDGEFIHKGSPCLCRTGFHFCQRLTDVFDYYNEGTDVYCPVTAFGAVAGPSNGDKNCTDAIRIGRRMTPPEIYAVLLKENPMLPKDHGTIDLVYARCSEREYFHRRLELLLRWRKRAGNYTKRKGKAACKSRKGIVRVGGRLRRRS